MQQILLNSGQQPQGSMKRAGTHEDVTGKGKLPWNTQLFESVQWLDVLKDGNCVWHSLNVHVNEKHREYDSGTCADFKARMITEMRDAKQEIAHMLGCAPDSFAKTLDAWMPDAVWADARTLLATGMLHASAIVIFNVSEQAIEVMSPWGTVDDATPLWLLMFEHDRFSPGVAGNLPLLLSTLEGLTLEPWKGKRHLAADGGSDTTSLHPKVMETSCAELP